MLAPSVTSGLPLVLLYAEAKLQQFIFHQFTEYNSMQVIVTALSAYFIGVHMRHLLAELSVLLPVPHTCVYMVVVRCALFRTNVLALPGMFCEHRLSGSKCPSSRRRALVRQFACVGTGGTSAVIGVVFHTHYQYCW